MSSTPRVEGDHFLFGDNAELHHSHERLYGTIMSHGVLDHPTKEVVRLRNARTTDCGV